MGDVAPYRKSGFFNNKVVNPLMAALGLAPALTVRGRASGRRYTMSVLQRIGNTPLIRIRLLEKEFPHITFYAKAEWFNPGGSVKDRPALRMIEEAERTGELTVERVILDSTSGNTGIAYALIGAAKGYQVKLVMPANVNEERREIVKAFGAEAIFTPALEGSDGAIREAHRIKESAPGVYFMPDQYNNPFNR